MIKLDVRGTRISICSQEPLTVGLVGEMVRFSFDESWNNLGKVVVFRQGQTARDQVLNGPLTKIPWEVLQQPGVPLEIGVYGTNADGRRVIPTLWVRTAPVEPAPEPVEDPGLEPTAEVWQQAIGGMGDLQALETKAKTDLVSAVNEAYQTAVDALEKVGTFLFTVLTGEDDSMYIVEGYTIEDLIAAKEAGNVLLCYWVNHAIYLSLAQEYRDDLRFVSVVQNKEYCVRVYREDIYCSTTNLATDHDKLPNPEKLTFTGAVEAEYDGSQALNLEIPEGALWVTVTAGADGTPMSTKTYSEIMAAHENDQAVYCTYNNLILPLISATQFSCTFGMIHYAGEVAGGYKNYRITIHPNGTVQASITPLEIPTTSSGSGIHTGTEPPTDPSIKFWINPDGGSDREIACYFEENIDVKTATNSVLVNLPCGFLDFHELHINTVHNGVPSEKYDYHIQLSGQGVSTEIATDVAGAYGSYIHFRRGDSNLMYYGSTSTSLYPTLVATSSFQYFKGCTNATSFCLFSKGGGDDIKAGTMIKVYGIYHIKAPVGVINIKNPDTGEWEGVLALQSGNGNITPGNDGGYYTPEVRQPEAGKMQIDWTASQEDMPAVEPKTIDLPIGPPGDTYQLTTEDKQEIAEFVAGMVDVPSGGGSGFNDNPLELINEITLEEDVHGVEFTTEADGTPLELEDFYIQAQGTSTTGAVNGHTYINDTAILGMTFVKPNGTALTDYTIHHIFNAGQMVVSASRIGSAISTSSHIISSKPIDRPITKIYLRMAAFADNIQSGSNFKLYGRRVKK